MPKRLVPYLEAITVVLIWAATLPLVKILLEDLSPYEIASFRYIGAFLLFVPLLIFFSRRILRAHSIQDLWKNRGFEV